MGSLWTLRKYRDGDEQAIVELMNNAFGKWHALEFWKWRYKKNPTGSPIVWLAEANNRLIGHVAVIPMRMKVGNSYITGSLSVNGAVHSKYQGKGVFSSLVNRCYIDIAENDIPLTYGFATMRLGPTYKRYEWRGHICFLLSMVKVLNWEPVLSRYLHNRILSQAGARVLERTGKNRSTNDCLKIEKVSRFDERIDTFWQAISQHFQIIVRRDQRYLNWRYINHPENEYTIYAAVKDHKILGYCVLHEKASQNLKLGLIDDLLGFQGHRNVVSYMIQKAIEHFKEHNLDLVSCREMSERHPYIAIFKKAGFITYPRRMRALHASINVRGSCIHEKAAYEQALLLSQNHFLKEKRNWFMMHGDGS